jgi:hypothetical protein
LLDSNGTFGDLVGDRRRVDLHSPVGRSQSVHHLAAQRAEIVGVREIAVGKEIGTESRVVPRDFRDGESRMTAEDRHDQRRAGTFGPDDENGALVKSQCHDVIPS